MNKFQEVTEKHVKESKAINAIDKTKCVWGELKDNLEKVLIYFEGKQIFQALKSSGEDYVTVFKDHVKLLEGPRDCNGERILQGQLVKYKTFVHEVIETRDNKFVISNGNGHITINPIECEIIKKNKIKDLPEDKQLMACVNWVKAQDYIVSAQLMNFNHGFHFVLDESVLANNIRNLNGIMIYKVVPNQEPIKIGSLTDQETIN